MANIKQQVEVDSYVDRSHIKEKVEARLKDSFKLVAVLTRFDGNQVDLVYLKTEIIPNEVSPEDEVVPAGEGATVVGSLSRRKQ
jgi:hypothetical protein